MIFVDTGAWFARYIASDRDHSAAVAWFSNVTDRLITTDYVIDELLTLLKVRGFADIAFTVGAHFFAGSVCQLEYVLPADVRRAWVTFTAFRDKGWSFTDCVSRAMMERLEIRVACSFDEHFRQFGNFIIVP